MSERFLITGATGFLGGTLARHLSGIGADVVATGRDATKMPKACAGFTCDLADDLTQDVISRSKGVTTIIHCAALSSPWGSDAAFRQANVTATHTVIALAKAVGASHLIFISSPSVYFQFADQFAVPEDMTLPPPVNAYAATKVAAEKRVKACGIPFTILRPRGLYGAGDTTLLPRLLRAAQAGPLPLFHDGAVCTDITHVDDVVGAIMAVIANKDASAGQVFNVSGGVPLPIKDVVEKVCDLHNVPLRWRPLPLRPALGAVRLTEWIARLRPGRPEPKVTAYGLGIFAFSQTLDLGHIQARLAWTPQISFEAGLACTFATKDAA